MTISTRGRDLAYALGRLGVLVTLGGASTYAQVNAAGEEEGDPDRGPQFNASLVSILIRVGTLPALQSGIVLSVAGVSYKVHRHHPQEDGALTRIVAYPVTDVAADLWVSGTILLPWATRVAGAVAGAAFDRTSVTGTAVLVLEVLAGATGDDPLLEVEVHDSLTEGGTYSPTGISFDPVTEEGDVQALTLPGSIGPWIKLVPTITGTGAVAFTGGAAAVAFAMPR